MTSRLPVRKFIKVWIKRRKNNPFQDGSRTTSYMLEWVEFGRRRFQSHGKHATASYSRQATAELEKELNAPERRESLDPITWENFRKKYLDTHLDDSRDLARISTPRRSLSLENGLEKL
jgi:hypothetical protein